MFSGAMAGESHTYFTGVSIKINELMKGLEQNLAHSKRSLHFSYSVLVLMHMKKLGGKLFLFFLVLLASSEQFVQCQPPDH